MAIKLNFSDKKDVVRDAYVTQLAMALISSHPVPESFTTPDFRSTPLLTAFINADILQTTPLKDRKRDAISSMFVDENKVKRSGKPLEDAKRVVDAFRFKMLTESNELEDANPSDIRENLRRLSSVAPKLKVMLRRERAEKPDALYS